MIAFGSIKDHANICVKVKHGPCFLFTLSTKLLIFDLILSNDTLTKLLAQVIRQEVYYFTV